MRTWQSVNINLLKYAIREGLFKPFCLFVLVKINFPKHTIFLNYSPNRFAKRFKMHPKTAERYIRRLLAAGFCEMRGKHLLFRNQEKICRDLGIEEKGRLSIQVRPWNRLSQIENRLYYLTLKINAAQQDFRNVVNNGIHSANSLLNKRTLNRAKKMHQQSLLWKSKSEASNDGRRFCSCRQTARLFNLSHTKRIDMVLLGNTYPPALVRRQVLVSPISIETARVLLAGGFMSYWGHENTIIAASKLLGINVTPETERPALILNADNLPTLNGNLADKVVVLSPNYASGYRPQEGEITPPEKIIGWQALLWDFEVLE